MILVSYDGSTDARAAVDRAAELMPGADATVITVWEPFADVMTRTGSAGMGMGVAGPYADMAKIDAASCDAALRMATAGVERAQAAGLVASPRSVSRHDGIANTILAAAQEVDADVIVMGTRGLSGVKSFFLGSVSDAVLQHADRAVLVVPSRGTAETRHGRIRADAVTNMPTAE